MKNTLLGITALLVIGALVAFSQLAHRPAPVPVKETNQAFQLFLQQFPPTTLPYTLSKERLVQHMMAEFQEENKPDVPAEDNQPVTHLNDPGIFLPDDPMERISRDPIYRQPVARMETADNYAVIYSAYHGFSRPFKRYLAVVFDKQGRLISQNEFASTGPDQVITGSINQNLHAVATSFHINWKKDIHEYGTSDNSVIGLSLETTREINLKKPTAEARFNRSRIRPVPVDIKTPDIPVVE